MSTMNMTTKFESQSLGMSAYKKQKTSLTSDKHWDGYLKLNSALTVSMVAFFHSGEKMPDVKWSESIEVKGKVKLQDFEKYIQELPRSRNKELTVISMYWKEGSSKLEFEEMKKVAKKYEEDGRVGIAKVTTGIDLYVCPSSDKIITILEKYGVFTGRAAFKENKDSLIGCVVWRRNQINHVNSSHQKSLESSRKNDPISVWSPIRTPFESSRRNYPISVWSPIRTPFESSRKNNPIVWSPIRTPFKSSTQNSPVLDITKQRDEIERDNNWSITPQAQRNFRLFGYYSDLVKSEDTPSISQSVCAEVETSNLNTNLLVPDVTTVTKQSLPSVILQKEPEQDLPKFEIETSTTCTETLLEEEMVQDMDISPPQSPQKQVCGKHQYDNMSSSTTLFAAGPQWNPFNACWYPPISNIPHSTYVGPMFHPMQTNFTPPSSAAKIHPPFPTHKSDFTYLGPTLMREHAHEYPHPHVHAKPHGQF